MTTLRKALSNRKCGLRWREAMRAAMLDKQILKLKGKVR